MKESRNRGNILEMLNVLLDYNTDVENSVLGKGHQNAQYISSQVQKEILLVYGMKIRKVIREEIGDAKFCILVDESRDQSKKEQMAMVLILLIKMVSFESVFLALRMVQTRGHCL